MPETNIMSHVNHPSIGKKKGGKRYSDDTDVHPAI